VKSDRTAIAAAMVAILVANHRESHHRRAGEAL
jgi:hypothetical protein